MRTMDRVQHVVWVVWKVVDWFVRHHISTMNFDGQQQNNRTMSVAQSVFITFALMCTSRHNGENLMKTDTNTNNSAAVNRIDFTFIFLFCSIQQNRSCQNGLSMKPNLSIAIDWIYRYEMGHKSLFLFVNFYYIWAFALNERRLFRCDKIKMQTFCSFQLDEYRSMSYQRMIKSLNFATSNWKENFIVFEPSKIE